MVTKLIEEWEYKHMEFNFLINNTGETQLYYDLLVRIDVDNVLNNITQTCTHTERTSCMTPQDQLTFAIFADCICYNCQYQ